MPSLSRAPRPSTAPPWRARLTRWARDGALLLALLWAVQAWQTRDVSRGAAPDFNAAAVSARPDAQLSLAQWRAARADQSSDAAKLLPGILLSVNAIASGLRTTG